MRPTCQGYAAVELYESQSELLKCVLVALEHFEDDIGFVVVEEHEEKFNVIGWDVGVGDLVLLWE